MSLLETPVVEVRAIELGGLVKSGHHRRLGRHGPVSSISHGPQMRLRFIQGIVIRAGEFNFI